jgi:hypothetical protein
MGEGTPLKVGSALAAQAPVALVGLELLAGTAVDLGDGSTPPASVADPLEVRYLLRLVYSHIRAHAITPSSSTPISHLSDRVESF